MINTVRLESVGEVRIGLNMSVHPPQIFTNVYDVTRKHLLFIIPCTLQLCKNRCESLLRAPGNELLQV